jgi:tetratricopeptide (TPR) repeat protein
MRRILLIFIFAAVAGLFFGATRGESSDGGDCQRPIIDAAKRIAACSRVIEQTKNRSFLAAAYSNRGNARRLVGQPDLAMADQNSAIQIDPSLPGPWASRANILMDRGDYDRAIADLDQCIRINPAIATCYLNRGTVWYRKGEYDRAIADHTIAISLDPSEWTSFNNRSNDWKEKGDYSHALEDINQAIRVAPNNPQIYSTRGELWRLMGDLDRAMADLNKAISLVPNNLPVWQNPFSLIFLRRGDVWRYRGEFDRALLDYNEALRFAGGMTLVYTNRGITYERLRDFTRARMDFQKALSLPEFNSDSSRSAQITARARLAALDSGVEQPSIPAAPAKAANQTSIPTPTLAADAVKSTAAKQGRRVALVIGNSAYKNVPVLTNPLKDAEAVAASLRNIGFETVTLANDATREKLIDGLRAFGNEAEKADWAMVYYAGHGIEVNGQNYLIPVDAKLAADRDVQFEAIPLEQVMASLEGAKKLTLVLLDACRDNPFAPQIRKTAAPDAAAAVTAGGKVGTRSIGHGLGEVKVQGASLVVFAAKHGQTALDGEGENSPFAVAMVQRIATPGVEINKIFRLVRDDVMEATAGRQEPYTYGSLPGKEDFFFVAAK